MKKYLLLVVFSTIVFTTFAFSSQNHHKSKYMGEENREIKSLSNDDIKELKKGGGWGLAKVAELNGYPGPSHLLKMDKKIKLSINQKNKIQKIFDKMKVSSISLGAELIGLEKKLNDAFKYKDINEIKLQMYVNKIENVRAKLRLVHTSTHLKTMDILTKKQIDLYNKLRGYS